jgi:tetratricopeptide (TPR) repeat protein
MSARFLLRLAAGASALLGLAFLAGGCAGGAPPAATAPGGATPSFLVASADTALASGDPDGARRLLLRAVEEAPESAFVHVALGRLHTAFRRYKDARESFDRAAQLDPLDPEPAYWLGKAYQQSGDLAAASQAYAAALRLDPYHRAAAAALGPILGARYAAAGVPAEYALLRDRPTVTRGELAVALAVEFGADPDRVSWRSDARPRGNDVELESAWGGRWAKAAVARGWIVPFADGSFHLDDPVTRAALALALAGLERGWAGDPSPSAAPRDTTEIAFADLGPRHYLRRAASSAVAAGLPLRREPEHGVAAGQGSVPDAGAGVRFDPWAAATGADLMLALRGMARRLGARPVVSTEPG